MPFVLAPLVVVGAALLGLIASMGFSSIMRAIGNALPKINIHITTIDLGAPFLYVAGKIEPLIAHAFKSSWKHIASWIYGHAWTLVNLASPIVHAIGDIVDQVNHHTTTAIPNAVKSAVHAADAHANAVGSATLRDAHAKAAADMVEAKRYADAAIAAAEKLAHSDLATTEHNLAIRITRDEATIAGLVTTVQATIPAEISAAVHAASAGEVAKLNSDKAAINARINTVNDAITTTNQKVASANTAITSANAQIDALHSKLATLAQQEASATGAVKTALQSDMNAVAAELQGAQAAVADNTAAIAAATGTIDQLRTEIDTARGAIGTIDARTTLSAAQDGVLGIAAGASIATAVAAVGAEVANIAECAVTTCSGPNNLSSLLEKELPGILGIAKLAGLGAFIEQAIQDPGGTAAATSAVAGTLESAGMDMVDLIKAL